MGRNKQIDCPICSKSIRKDNLKRHLSTHPLFNVPKCPTNDVNKLKESK